MDNFIASEYVFVDDDTEICPECGHIRMEDGRGHYHDCRYFCLEDSSDFEESSAEDVIHHPQLSLFRPAA